MIEIHEKQLAELKPQQFNAIYDHHKLREEYINYASRLRDAKVFTGFPELDSKMNGLRPGEVMTIIAPTNTGKSAMALNLLYQMAKQSNDLIFYASTELGSADIFERFVQLHFRMNVEDVEKMYSAKNVNDSEVVNVIDLLGHVYAIIKKLKPTELTQYIQYISENTGKRPRCLIVDHLQGLKLPASVNKAESLDLTMQYLKEIALHLNLPIILTAHVSREEAKGKMLSLYSGKGSGEIENSSQIVFSLERFVDLPEDVKPAFHIEIMQEYGFGKIDLLKFTAHKKKRGQYKDVFLKLDLTSLKFSEIKPIM